MPGIRYERLRESVEDLRESEGEKTPPEESMQEALNMMGRVVKRGASDTLSSASSALEKKGQAIKERGGKIVNAAGNKASALKSSVSALKSSALHKAGDLVNAAGNKASTLKSRVEDFGRKVTHTTAADYYKKSARYQVRANSALDTAERGRGKFSNESVEHNENKWSKYDAKAIKHEGHAAKLIEQRAKNRGSQERSR